MDIASRRGVGVRWAHLPRCGWSKRRTKRWRGSLWGEMRKGESRSWRVPWSVRWRKPGRDCTWACLLVVLVLASPPLHASEPASDERRLVAAILTSVSLGLSGWVTGASLEGEDDVTGT